MALYSEARSAALAFVAFELKETGGLSFALARQVSVSAGSRRKKGTFMRDRTAWLPPR